MQCHENSMKYRTYLVGEARLDRLPWELRVCHHQLEKGGPQTNSWAHCYTNTQMPSH